MADESSPRKEAREQVHLARERTYLSHERTLMAWIRTGAALITFGFTLFKFFEYLNEAEQIKLQRRLFSPRTFGTLLIVIGIVALVVATWQHRNGMKKLREHYPDAPFSLALLMAGLISALGILALAATVF